MLTIKQQCQTAAAATQKMLSYSTNTKNAALKNMAQAILDQTTFILKENKKDLDLGKKKGISKALLDRPKRLQRNRIEKGKSSQTPTPYQSKRSNNNKSFNPTGGLTPC